MTPRAMKPTHTHLVRAVNEVEVCQHLVDYLKRFADGLSTQNENGITRQVQGNTLPKKTFAKKHGEEPRPESQRYNQYQCKTKQNRVSRSMSTSQPSVIVTTISRTMSLQVSVMH